MSRRAKSSENAVSLFPFLAVLICAMGALILLLLVTTRRIRHQQTQKAAAVVNPVEQAASLPDKPPPDANTPSPVPAPEHSEYLDAPLTPLFALEPLPVLQDPNKEWRTRLQQLQSEQTKLAAAIAERESAIERIRTAAAARAGKLADLDQEQSAVDEESRTLARILERLHEQEIDADERAAFLRREIEVAREKIANADSKFAIVPYDGRLGTVRRPIILECTRDSITFVSEGVTLTASDLDGFTPQSNPLAVCVRALTKYWARRDGKDIASEFDGEPYVLLVVRPQGTIAYYTARKLLGPSLDTFGYELVRDDQEFVWPESDPAATQICRAIVERMLSDRDAFLASVPSGTAERLRHFSDGRGGFRLEEVDRLRDPDRGATVNGLRYLRQPAQVNGRVATRSIQPETAFSPSRANEESPYRSEQGDLAATNMSAGTGSEKGSRDQNSLPVPPQRLPFGTSADPHPLRSSPLNPTERPQLAQPASSPFSDFIRSTRPGTHGPTNAAGQSARLGADQGSQPSSGDASATRNGQGSGQDPHVMLDLMPHVPSGVPPGVNGENPQWGVRRPDGSIGFEREITIRVTDTEVTIADETSFPVSPGISVQELRNQFAVHLNHQVRSWGEPPRSFYWAPAINFQVSPAGNLHYERLRGITQKWKVRCTVKLLPE